MPLQATESTLRLAYGVRRMHADLQEHTALCTTTNDRKNANKPTLKNPTGSICAETESTHWKYAGMGFTHPGRIGSRHHVAAAAVGDGRRGTQARSCLPGALSHSMPQGTVSSQSSHNIGETK